MKGMKCKNIFKRGLAVTLAVAMVVVGSGVQTPSAGAKKAKTPKLSKKKISATVGAQTTLSVSNAKKKVKWSTSNKKIVKISSKSGKKKSTATLVAVKKGKATITAKVGKKKLKCVVTVKASSISKLSFDPLDSTVVVMTLAKKAQLSATDIKVGYKEYQEGRFNQKPVVESLTTTDQKTYRLYLSRSVYNGDFVKISYGKSEKTVQRKNTFKQDDDKTTLIMRKDEVIRYSLDSSVDGEIGDVVYSLKKGAKLPKGLVLSGKKGLLKGIPSEAGASTVALQAKDGLGRKATLNLTIKVYDETTLAAMDDHMDVRLDDYVADRNTVVTAGAVTARVNASDYYASYTIKPYGGSEKYKFSVADDGSGVKLTTDVTDVATGAVSQEAAQTTTLCIPYTIPAGEHNFVITVTDAADANRTTTVTIKVNAKQYVNISGTVKDNAGNPLSGNEAVYLVPADADSLADSIDTVQYERYTKDAEGDFKAAAGNKVKGYSYDDTYEDDANESNYYKVGIRNNSAQVGPYPQPTILREEPTPAPSAEATQAPEATATPAGYRQVELADGAYQAEVPAGKYIVKVKAANDIMYEAVAQMDVAADGTQDINMPTRFAKVTGTARYANDNPVINSLVYFEMTSGLYEGAVYSVRTNYAGVYVASLPAGTYNTYIIDEKSQYLYFTSPLTVADGVDLNAADMKLAVSKSIVEGVFTSKLSETETVREPYQYFYLYDDQGVCQRFSTTGTKRVKDEATGEYKEADDSCIFKINLYDGVYNVRVRTGSSDGGRLYSVGTITVAGANIQGASRLSFAMEQDSYLASAADIALDTPMAAVSSGNNNLLYKFTPAEDGNYSIVTSQWGKAADNAPVVLTAFDGVRTEYSSIQFSNTQSGERFDGYQALKAGRTYYIDVTPYGSYDQLISSQTIKVTKFQHYYDQFAAPVTFGTPQTVKTLGNHPVEKMNGQAVLKMNVTAGNTYTIAAQSTTIGAQSVLVDVITLENGIYEREANGDIEYLSRNNGSRTITYTAGDTGVCYVLITTRQNANVNVTVNETAPVQTPAPTPTVSPAVPTVQPGASESPAPGAE